MHDGQAQAVLAGQDKDLAVLLRDLGVQGLDPDMAFQTPPGGINVAIVEAIAQGNEGFHNRPRRGMEMARVKDQDAVAHGAGGGSDLFQDMDGAGGAHAEAAPHYVGHAHARALNFPIAGLAPQMRADLVDIGNARGAQGVPLGQQATRDIDRNLAAQGGFAASIKRPASPSSHRPRFS